MSDLIPQYRAMAADGASFRGLTILSHADAIGALIAETNSRSVLDYGCGAGDAYRSPHKLWRRWGLKWTDVTLYDPAFPHHCTLPDPTKRFDAVVCSDVLEHVPEDQVEEVIERLIGYARGLVWASVCCRPAKKFFADGVTNLHVTQRPLEWWKERFDAAWAQDRSTAKVVLIETP